MRSVEQRRRAILPRSLREACKRIRSKLGKTEEIDEEKLRDRAIRQLQTAANLAYGMMRDERIDVKTRQAWFKRYTDAIRTLSKVLKEREEKDWENRLRIIEEYRKRQNTTMGSSGSPGENQADSQPQQGSQA